MAQESNKEEKDAVAEGGDGADGGSGDEKKEEAEAEDRKKEDGNEGEASEEGNPVCTTPTFTFMQGCILL